MLKYIFIMWSGLFMLAQADLNKLEFKDTAYLFANNSQKCLANSFKLRKSIIDDIRDNNGVIENFYETDAGNIHQIIINIEGEPFYFWFMDSYGACKLYEALVIKKEDVKDGKKFMEMKDPANVKK